MSSDSSRDTAEDSNIEDLNTDDDNPTGDDQVNIEELDQLDLETEEEDLEDEVDVGDIDITTIPSIDTLKARDDVKITELLGYIDKYQHKIEIYQAKYVKIKEQKREVVKKHRGSVIDVHNRMFKKLIETENEQKTELERTQDRVHELEAEVEKYRLNEETIAAVNNGDDPENFKSAQLQKYLDEVAKLEKENEELRKKNKEIQNELKVEKMKHERVSDSHRKSISTLHTNMFKKLLDAEDDFEDKIDTLKEEITQKDRELQMEKLKNEQSDRLRRDSIQTVHNNMLTKLLDAQAEHDEKEEKLNNRIKELESQLRQEILKNDAKADKRAEQGDDIKSGDVDDNASDLSDLETEEQTRNESGKQKFDDLWDEADEPEAEIDRLKAHIEKIERELKEEKEKNVYIEKQRKDSIHNLHNNMFQKLLDAEFEYEEEIERLHKEKEELNEKIIFYEDAFEKMNKNDGNNYNGGGGDGGQQSVVNPTEVIELKDEIKQKDDVIEENKERIFHLTQKIEKLEVQIQNEQKQRRGSVSFLSKQMMAKLLEAEEENEEQKQKFKEKLKRLEKELEESKEMSFNLERTRRNSVTKVSQTMFHKLLQAEQTKKQMIQEYEDKIADLEKKLAAKELEAETVKSKQEINSMEVEKYKTKAEELEAQVVEIKNDSVVKEKKRRESLSQLQNSYWKKLLEAEDDHELQIKKLKQEIVRLQQINETLTASKLNLIIECNKQMNDLRKAVAVYHQNASSSTSSSWFG